MITCTPIENRIVVEPDDSAKLSAGGIIIPDTALEKPQRGTVVAAGPGKKNEPMTIMVGESVLYGKGSGTPIDGSLIGGAEGKTYLIMREPDIFAVI